MSHGQTPRATSTACQSEFPVKEPIYRGSVKDVYRIDETRLEFAFSDRISIFDVVMPDDIPGKGEALCDMACHWFKVVDELGIDHHFIERSGPRSMVVKPVTIIRDASKIIDGRTNHLIPLEFIVRHYVAGMLFDRMESGKIPPARLGFGPGEVVPYGTKLPKPFFEMSTKLEPVDRFVTHDEALTISKLGGDGIQRIQDICLNIDTTMERLLEPTDLIHVDGKKEFGYDTEGTLMLVDVFGTADEDRYWERRAYAQSGECIELSKEKVRQHYRAIGYKDALYAARDKGTEEPPMPPLPKELLDGTAQVYRSIADQMCSVSL